MKTISIVNLKGGVGKTSTTLSVAAALAERGKRVLLLDADHQCNLSLHLRANMDGADICTILDGDEPYYENLLQHTYLRGVDIVPGSLDLMAYDLGVLNGNPQRRAAIRDFAAALAEDDAYDYLLVDCPPAFSASCAATLYAADEVIIPTSIGQYEEWGVANLTRQIDGMLSVNPNLHLGGLLVTMWHNAPLVVQGEARMREAFPGRVFRTVIRRTDKVGESAYYRESVLDYSPTSAAARDYRKFVDEYFGGEANGEGKV